MFDIKKNSFIFLILRNFKENLIILKFFFNINIFNFRLEIFSLYLNLIKYLL